MSRRFEQLVQRLDQAAGVSEYVAEEIDLQAAIHRRVGPQDEIRDVVARRVSATVFRDLLEGRGEDRFQITDDEQDIRTLIEDAVERAGGNVGPAWTSPPPAAPARVPLDDPRLDVDLHAAIKQLGETFAGLHGASSAARAVVGADIAAVEVTIGASRGDTALRTNLGFSSAFRESRVWLTATLAAGGRVERVAAQARRVADLALAERVADAARRLRDKPRAQSLAPGRYDVVITGEALLPALAGALAEPAATAIDEPAHLGYGWFAPIVAQADAGLFRRGLTRYRPGASIHGEAPITGDGLTLISDGTRPYGPHSRPFGSLGEPVRRFTLVERGVAAALAVDLRAAALTGNPANGGVRNLSVALGKTTLSALQEPGERPLLVITDVDTFDSDPRTGELWASVGLGYLDRDRRQPVQGGILRDDLLSMWSRARLADEPTQRDWYEGPVAIRFDDVTLA